VEGSGVRGVHVRTTHCECSCSESALHTVNGLRFFMCPQTRDTSMSNRNMPLSAIMGSNTGANSRAPKTCVFKKQGGGLPCI